MHSSLHLLKPAANLWGHVLEDTAEVLHSLAGTSFGVRGHFRPNFYQGEIFEKVIEKEHFWVILRILLVKPKHLPPHSEDKKCLWQQSRKEDFTFYVF